MHTAGYLNLAADFTHNFTDGIAIGKKILGKVNPILYKDVSIFHKVIWKLVMLIPEL